MYQVLEHACKNCGYSDIIRYDPDEINFKCSKCHDITGLEKDKPLKCENKRCRSDKIIEWEGECPKCGGRFEISYNASLKYEQMSRDNPHIGYTHSGYNWKTKRELVPDSNRKIINPLSLEVIKKVFAHQSFSGRERRERIRDFLDRQELTNKQTKVEESIVETQDIEKKKERTNSFELNRFPVKGPDIDDNRNFFSKFLSTEAQKKRGKALEKKKDALLGYGYSIWSSDDSKRTDEERYHALTKRALPELGLEEVARRLVSLIKWRENSPLMTYKNAVKKWTLDLNKLKRDYYDKNTSAYDFAWPVY